jgi:hypothetical protein
LDNYGNGSCDFWLVFVSKSFSFNDNNNNHHLMMPMFHRRNPFPNATRYTTLFVSTALEDPNTTYTLFRKPSRLLTSGMAIIIMPMRAGHPPVHARLGRITAAEPAFVEFMVHFKSHVACPLRVPADWVQLNLWEKIRFSRHIHTPESFMTTMDDAQSEADMPVAPVSHAISRLRPSISMFELNVQPPQED